MSPLAIILKAESTHDSRTIAYETYRKQTVIIVQQDYQLDEWVTVHHMAVPIVIFDFTQSFRFEKGLMKGAHYLLDFVTSYVSEFVFDPDTLDEGVRKFFYYYDVKEIPLYENQEGYWRDLELVESIWKMKPDIESRETFSEPSTPAMVHHTIVCTPQNKPENKPHDVSNHMIASTILLIIFLCHFHLLYLLYFVVFFCCSSTFGLRSFFDITFTNRSLPSFIFLRSSSRRF